MALANFLLSHSRDDEIGSILSEYSVNFVPVVDNGPEAAIAKPGDCAPANTARKNLLLDYGEVAPLNFDQLNN